MDILLELVFPIGAVLIVFYAVLRFLQRKLDEEGTILPENSSVMRLVALVVGLLLLAFVLFEITQSTIYPVLGICGIGLLSYSILGRHL